MPDQSPPRPGPVKIRSVPLTQKRRVDLVAAFDGRWRELLERADVMSEGRVVDEREGRVYYGSTTVVVQAASAGGDLPDLSLDELVILLRHDPHVRLRAVRIAHREACTRAPMPIAALHAELEVRRAPGGVMLSIDVVARATRRRARIHGGGS